jgi:hypothetical protein
VIKMPRSGAIQACGRFKPDLASGLLKWLNSPYRPTWPEESAPARPAAFQTAYWGVAKW